MSEEFGYRILPAANDRTGSGPELPGFVAGKRAPAEQSAPAQKPRTPAKARTAPKAQKKRAELLEPSLLGGRASALGGNASVNRAKPVANNNASGGASGGRQGGGNGNSGYAASGYSNNSYGNSGYGNSGYGNSGGNNGYSNNGYGNGGGNNGNNASGGARRPRRRRSRPKPLFVAAVSALCLMFTALAIVFLSNPPGAKAPSKPPTENTLQEPDSGKFFPGITIDGVEVGSLTYAEAKGKVEPGVSDKLASVNYSLSLEGKQYSLSAEDIKANVDYEAVLHEAFDIGRNTSVPATGGIEFKTKLTFDEAALAAALADIAKEASVAPVEPYALVNTKSGDRFIYKEGTSGKQADTDGIAAQISQLIAAETYQASLEIPTSAVSPKHTVEDVRANTKKVDSATTYFNTTAGSKPERVFNIEKTVGILNKAELKPGQEWSFNEFVGPRTLSGGWKEAPGIVNGNSYEMQAGGGICQVSTTLFNAALKADLEIVSSRRHSWPSSYVDYGLDATVSTGGPDLVIRNNKDFSVFFFATVNTDEKSVTVSVYGPNTLGSGTKIKLYSKTTDEIEPPEPKIIEDAKQPTGYKETVIEARSGYTCEVYREFVRDGETVKTEKLYSHKYRAVQGKLLVGTGSATAFEPNPPPAATEVSAR